MTTISQYVLVEAARRVRRMSLKERERLADEIYVQQPNLLASVLVLRQFGVTMAQMEVVLNFLLACHEAMKRSGRTWPLITEDDQDLCLRRLTARAKFSEGLSDPQQDEVAHEAVATHPELQLLAYAHAVLQDQGWDRIETEPLKMLVLCMLNLVECVAYRAPNEPSGRRHC